MGTTKNKSLMDEFIKNLPREHQQSFIDFCNAGGVDDLEKDHFEAIERSETQKKSEMGSYTKKVIKHVIRANRVQSGDVTIVSEYTKYKEEPNSNSLW